MVNPDDGIYPRIPGLVPATLLASMRGMQSAKVDSTTLAQLLNDYIQDVAAPYIHGWNVSHGPYLYCLIRLARLGYVVETGVCDSESTVSILAAMARNGFGQLFSCDINLPMSRVFRFLASDFGKKVRVSLRLNSEHAEFFTPRYRDTSVVPLGLACPEWHFDQSPGVTMLGQMADPHGPHVNEIPRAGVDLFFHDSDHSYANQKAEYDLAWKLVRPGGLIGGDDVEWDKPPWAWSEFCSSRGLKGTPFGAGRMVRKPGA